MGQSSGSRMPDVIFNGPEGRLEGRTSMADRRRAPIALMLHPHPQHGGTMNNKVVYTLVPDLRAARLLGAAVQFPRSRPRRQGSFDRGEGELSDAASALDWLQAYNPNAASLLDRGLLVRRLDRHAAPDAPAGDRRLHLGGAAGQHVRFRLPRPLPVLGPDPPRRPATRSCRRSRCRSSWPSSPHSATSPLPIA